ncbi:hypothetical protein LC605_15975 [Nostoc sp. CHAB 5836]|uniref:hypothetical protein n=1 Tax=Nostoc sp. CHAB 5836 TaxID=2780404 RepID=UPI001E48494C|nr:hypothetical protein [Nostoc sp. CHAB 5836]MCC5616543.1 hypothetical protein [Nostoc sp. CHAB 5836]
MQKKTRPHRLGKAGLLFGKLTASLLKDKWYHDESDRPASAEAIAFHAFGAIAHLDGTVIA